MNINDIKKNLQQLSETKGARLFGVGDIEDLVDTFHFEIKKPARQLHRAIALGVPVSDAVLGSLTDHPNVLYKSHYRNINHILNDVAHFVAQDIIERGFRAIPIPASQILNWKPMSAHLSHRVVGHRAGLGWRGKNNLLVNNKYGSQIRLVTVLTNLMLEPDRPVADNCGECQACRRACPAEAIGETPEDFNLEKCFRKVAEFARPENIGSYICGLCLKPCPGKIKKQEC